MVHAIADQLWSYLHFTPGGLERLGEVASFLDQLHEEHHNHAEDIEAEFHRQLEYLNDYGGAVSEFDPRRRFKVTLGRDWAPLSFSVTWERLDARTNTYGFGMVGGLIWHGGSNDPLTVTLTPCWWGIHT